MDLASALQNGLDDGKPSLFELLSEQQLSGLIPPSLRYLLVLATHRRPRYLLRVLNSFDELYALLALLVERHYLRTHGGGFVEHFYGLKRERALRLPSVGGSGSSGGGGGAAAPRTQRLAPERLREVTRLRDGDVWRNLLVMVGLPYLKRKLDEAHAVHAPPAALAGRAAAARLEQPPPGAPLRQRIMYCYKWFLRRVYPSVNAAYHFAVLAFQLAYLFSATAYPSPFLWLVRTRIRRLEAADYHAIALASEQSAAAAAAQRRGSLLRPRNLAQAIVPRLFAGLKLALPASIFALKFLEWWHASDFPRQLSRRAAEGLDLPPPTVTGLPERSPAEKQPSPPSQQQSPSVGQLAEGPDQAPPKSPPKSALKARKPRPPVAASSRLPILTVPAPTAATSALCPICMHALVNPTAAQTGFVFCYTCIFRWVDGSHERQAAWMRGGSDGEGWGDEEGLVSAEEAEEEEEEDGGSAGREAAQRPRRDGSREGKWESGLGRCAVTGRRLLGGTGGLRRVIV